MVAMQRSILQVVETELEVVVEEEVLVYDEGGQVLGVRGQELVEEVQHASQ